MNRLENVIVRFKCILHVNTLVWLVGVHCTLTPAFTPGPKPLKNFDGEVLEKCHPVTSLTLDHNNLVGGGWRTRVLRQRLDKVKHYQLCDNLEPSAPETSLWRE